MKNNQKLKIKKVTLQNLDESALDAVAGAYPTIGPTCGANQTCPQITCVTCAGHKTC